VKVGRLGLLNESRSDRPEDKALAGSNVQGNQLTQGHRNHPTISSATQSLRAFTLAQP